MVGMDTSILMHPRIWQASGHIEGFSDPLVECKSCHRRRRSDDLEENRCPSCGGELPEPSECNLRVKTHMEPGVVEAGTVPDEALAPAGRSRAAAVPSSSAWSATGNAVDEPYHGTVGSSSPS